METIIRYLELEILNWGCYWTVVDGKGLISSTKSKNTTRMHHNFRDP